jgi:type IV pilus assembly protein PilM
MMARKNALVGLDIGSHSIKLVEVDYTRKGIALRNVGLIGLPPDAIVEGSIKELEIVTSAIRSLFSNLKVKQKNVAASISGYSVIIKKISVARRDEMDLERTIHNEAEQYIPFDINDVNLDFDILEPLTDISLAGEKGLARDESDHLDVILVAAKKDIVNDYANLLQNAGLNPVILDVDSFALQNAFEMSLAEEEGLDGTCVLINVGAEELGINVVHNGTSLFTRDSGFGGAQITEAIMSRFNVSYEEAEKMKLAGLAQEKHLTVLEKIFVSTVSDWVQEIKRAIDFVVGTYPEKTISKLVVSGGSCRIPGFQRHLQRETGLPVEPLDPFRNLKVNTKKIDMEYLNYIAPQVAVAMGLALRSIGDK